MKDAEWNFTPRDSSGVFYRSLYLSCHKIRVLSFLSKNCQLVKWLLNQFVDALTEHNRQLGRHPGWNLGCYWRHVTCRLSPVLIVACRRDFLDAEIINFVAQLTPLVKQKLILSLISFKKRNERSTDSRIISICVGEVKKFNGPFKSTSKSISFPQV